MKFKVLAVVALLIVLLMVVGQLAGNDEMPSSAVGEPVVVPMSDGNDVRLRVVQKGTGPDVVLIHGLPGSIEDWSPVIDGLATQFRVTAYDRVGHGYSDGNPSYSDLKGNVDILDGLLKTLDVKTPVLVGHSYGGAMALALAKRNPTVLRGVVAVAPYLQKSGLVSLPYYALRLPWVGPGIAALSNPVVGPMLMEDGLQVAFAPAAVPQEFVAERAPIWLQVKNSLATAYESIAFKEDQRWLQELETVQLPVWLIHGAQDALVSVQDSLNAHSQLPASELKVIEGQGHYINWFMPELVVNAVSAIIDNGMWEAKQVQQKVGGPD